MALGREDGIQQLDQIQALRDVEQRGNIAESGYFGFKWLRRLVGLLGGGHQILDLTEVDLADDLRFAIHALAIASVVIGVAADLFGGEARHI